MRRNHGQLRRCGWSDDPVRAPPAQDVPRAAIFATMRGVRRLSRIVVVGPRAGLLSLAVLAGCLHGRGGDERAPTPAPVVTTDPTVVASSATTTIDPPAAVVEPAPVEPPPPQELAGAELRRRYQLTTAKQTLVGDRGGGYDDLYGTRNVRAVLNGIFYRGGANNAFHGDATRANKNPLPEDALANLCKQGFGTAIYLYPHHFDTAAKATTCQTVDGREGHLEYEQISTQHGKRADLRIIFGQIVDHIHEPSLGPLFAHCWNGWHASGYLGAVVLRQFCGFSPDQGLRYWTLTAKGASNSDHDETKARITKFKPFPEYTLTAEERAAMCPDPKTLAFPSPEPAPAP